VLALARDQRWRWRRWGQRAREKRGRAGVGGSVERSEGVGGGIGRSEGVGGGVGRTMGAGAGGGRDRASGREGGGFMKRGSNNEGQHGSKFSFSSF
jgi:hypothetical protein